MTAQKIETGHQDTVHDVSKDYYGKSLGLTPNSVLYSLLVLAMPTLFLLFFFQRFLHFLIITSFFPLAGVITEYLWYEYVEGGLNDTNQKADLQVRLSVLNIALILRRHEAARLKLADAMLQGMSIG
ncbi:hypothetical protein ACFE04_028610 [Oxalis oulophora]